MDPRIERAQNDKLMQYEKISKDAILKMKTPTGAIEMRTFPGMVTYYRDMWLRRSHILAPFTEVSGLPKKTKLK